MKTKKIFIIPVLALLAAGCQEDDMGGKTTAQPGEEVAFSATLGGDAATTRTIYGDRMSGVYPIYWDGSDEVKITSPQCENGGNPEGRYSVLPVGGTYSATGTLTRTSEFGVRWGNAESGYTFYSVYPASNATFADNQYETATLTMPTTQTVTRANDGTSEYDMNACFMYAKTTGVDREGTVGLTYVPISTTIRFTLQGPDSGSAVAVESIIVTAPDGTKIAGDFEAKLGDVSGSTSSTSTPVPPLSGGSSNVITIDVTGSNTLNSTTDTIGVNVFFLLEEDTEIAAGKSWEVKVRTNVGDFTKNLPNGTLKSGQIHELGKLPPLSLDDGNNDCYQDGSTWYVGTAECLVQWAEAVSSNRNLNCTLIADIDMEGVEWTPVLKDATTNSAYYCGTFDGQGNTIYNLTVTAGSDGYAALIGNLNSNGIVKNLKMENVSITGGRYVGAIVGYSNGTVENCNVISGTIYGAYNSSYSYCYVGGAVGYNNCGNNNNTGSVTNCTVSATIGSDTYITTPTFRPVVGGVVGITSGNNGTATATMENCIFKGTFNSGGFYVGGVVGQINNSSIVTACYNEAYINSAGSYYSGGVVGSLDNSALIACYNKGDVYGGTYLGGVVGYIGSSQTALDVTACYNAGTTSKPSGVAGGGIVGYCRADKFSACYWIGASSGIQSGGVTSSDGVIPVDDATTWYNAQEGMNIALENAECNYSYEDASDTKDASGAPTLKKNE